MEIISMRDFRSNQTAYLKKIKKGDEIILKSRTEGSFKLTPVTESDRLITEEHIKNGLSGEELQKRMFNYIDKLFAK